jgi:hypothetical protein
MTKSTNSGWLRRPDVGPANGKRLGNRSRLRPKGDCLVVDLYRQHEAPWSGDRRAGNGHLPIALISAQLAIEPLLSYRRRAGPVRRVALPAALPNQVPFGPSRRAFPIPFFRFTPKDLRSAVAYHAIVTATASAVARDCQCR